MYVSDLATYIQIFEISYPMKRMASDLLYNVHDRTFWIYFIVTLFFTVIGTSLILSSNDPYMIIILIGWILANVALMIITYHASLAWAPIDHNDSVICVIDSNAHCFDVDNRLWLFINMLFILLLIISTLWAAELSNGDAGPLRSMSGVLMLLGGLVMYHLSGLSLSGPDSTPFWMAVGYLLIWFALTLYMTLTS